MPLLPASHHCPQTGYTLPPPGESPGFGPRTPLRFPAGKRAPGHAVLRTPGTAARIRRYCRHPPAISLPDGPRPAQEDFPYRQAGTLLRYIPAPRCSTKALSARYFFLASSAIPPFGLSSRCFLPAAHTASASQRRSHPKGTLPGSAGGPLRPFGSAAGDLPPVPGFCRHTPPGQTQAG